MSQVIQEEKKIEAEVQNIIDGDRVVNFSDAVFAFAATLLVLKIDLPQIHSGQVEAQLANALIALWPTYLANIIAFLVIGYYWLNHHAIFGMIRKFDSTIVWLNLIFLIFLSFLPFPVDLYGDYPTVRVVVVFYCASLAFVGYLMAILWWYASDKKRLVTKELGKKQMKYYFVRVLIAPVIFTVSIPLVYIHPMLAQLSWLFILFGSLAANAYYCKGKP